MKKALITGISGQQFAIILKNWYDWSMGTRIHTKPKYCKCCGVEFNRGISRGGKLESVGDFSVRKYCSKMCYHKSNSGSGHYAFKSEGSVRFDGYVRVTLPGSARRYLHRVVMEEKLGRPLLPTEHVHHRDGNPSNNNPDNLEILDSCLHSRLHDPERSRDAKTKRYVTKKKSSHNRL